MLEKIDIFKRIFLNIFYNFIPQGTVMRDGRNHLDLKENKIFLLEKDLISFDDFCQNKNNIN